MTDKPIRVQLSRKKGWRLPPNTVKVDRTTSFGNPYRIGEPVDAKVAERWGFKLRFHDRQAIDTAHAVELFSRLFVFTRDDAQSYVVRNMLRGKNLACWCALDAPCHADVLLEIANDES